MRSPRSERLPFFDALTRAATRANSLLCIGLDPAPDQIPANLRAAASSDAEAALAWNRTIIEATADLVCAYKPNSAFYEAMGEEGMACLRGTLDLIPPEVPIILDVKRSPLPATPAADSSSSATPPTPAPAPFSIWRSATGVHWIARRTSPSTCTWHARR
jgi:orotidine-5'-phosphate decarboxylase